MNGGYAPARSPAALIGAIGIPAGIGAFLIAGLAVTVIPDDEVESLVGVLIEDETVELPPPPPPDPVEPVTQKADPVTDVVKLDPFVIPDSPVTVSTFTPVETTSSPIDDFVVAPVDAIEAFPSPLPSFDPISAKPRNQPSRWVTDRDYKSRWIREGLSGVARFTLQIDANGRVSDCTITRSTTHAALDAATCKLVSDRARFTPARGSDGAITSGTYSSSIRWDIPD
jgi:protein TonB